MKRLLTIPLLLLLFFITFPVNAQQLQPEPTLVTPTLFCLGSCPNQTVSPTQSTDTNPTAIPTNANPSGTNNQPSSTPISSIPPCISSVNSASVHAFKVHIKSNGSLSQLFNLLLQFILQLLERLLGINLQLPSTRTPQPTSAPASPAPSGLVPTVNPCATQSPNAPTTSVSGAPAPTGSATNTPTGSTTTAPAPTGSSALEPGGQPIPTDNVAGWKLIFSDDFPGTVPLGAFSNCASTQTPTGARCAGLKPYGAYYNDWWAYPDGWEDTAKSGADGNGGAPYGGTYQPDKVVSVSNGAMHIHMYRPTTGGDNAVATVVPIPCMAHEYGRYTERFKVVQYQPGFKSAHLFYQGGFEIDYPENDYGTTISAYTHPGGANFNSGAKWTDAWHTTVIEWTAGQVKFYMDGKLIGTTTAQVPNIPMDWILQNESSILGPYAANGASSQLDIDWVACYAQG